MSKKIHIEYDLGVWTRSHIVEVSGSYAERWEHHITQYTCSGLIFKTDWRIQKREDTVKPYILMTIGSGQRYGAFNKLISAKIAAYLFEFG